MIEIAADESGVVLKDGSELRFLRTSPPPFESSMLITGGNRAEEVVNIEDFLEFCEASNYLITETLKQWNGW